VTAVIVPPSEIARRREERERLRRAREAQIGSILGGILDDDEPDRPSAACVPAKHRSTEP